MTLNQIFYTLAQLLITVLLGNCAQIPNSAKQEGVEPTVRIQCLSGVMVITIKDVSSSSDGSFSGVIYPKGLSKNSSCLSEYRNHRGSLKYKLPLRSCNTMPQEMDDGGLEFFNTIVLQPHLKLFTDLGRGYHVRCRYKSRDSVTSLINSNEIAQPYRSENDDDDDDDDSGKDSSKIELNDRRYHGRSLDKNEIIIASSDSIVNSSHTNEISMPGCHMKIYSKDKIAESVKIGDPLTLVVNIDEQNTYGLHVTDCLVRDGLGWGEQKLVNEEGCPLDTEIMDSFEYTKSRTAARVTFPAHKFPYTASVYYQCYVRLCPLEDPKCHETPECGNTKRSKRQANKKDDEGMPATIEVYSGLYVNENNDIFENGEESVSKKKTAIDALCVSQRTFAVATAIAGLILMLTVVASVLCILAKKRNKTVSNSGSSIYSGPYTNTVFSQSS